MIKNPWRASISSTPAIPHATKDALLVMIEQVEHEFFGPWIGAALTAGVAAGLKGVGRDIIGSLESAGATSMPKGGA